jgi:hypothetical protein
MTSFCWKRGDFKNIPPNAISVGQGRGTPSYVSRGYHEDGEHPGLFTPKDGCLISYGGQQISKTEFEILTANESDYQWRPIEDLKQIVKKMNPVLLGYDKEYKKELYGARIKYKGAWVAGKVGM